MAHGCSQAAFQRNGSDNAASHNPRTDLEYLQWTTEKHNGHPDIFFNNITLLRDEILFPFYGRIMCGQNMYTVVGTRRADGRVPNCLFWVLGGGVGWGGVVNDVNVPWTYPHGWCYATWWGGVGWGMMLTFLELQKHHKTFWKNSKKFWRSKSKCQNASSFRFHKKRTFVIEHNRMVLTKREYQWNCAEKSRAAAWTPKTNGNTDSKLSKIQTMYWKHHGRLHTVYPVVHHGSPSCVLLGHKCYEHAVSCLLPISLIWNKFQTNIFKAGPYVVRSKNKHRTQG